MNKVAVLVGLLQFIIVPVLLKTIPSFIPLCKRNAELSKCIINTYNEIRPYLKRGIPELDLPPGDPLNFLNISANTGQGSSVAFEAQSWNQIATGLMESEIKELTIDVETPKVTVVLSIPYVRLQGDYKLKGKVLLFELNSEGKSDINATDVTATAEAMGKFHTKKGKRYGHIDKLNLVLQMKKTVIYFTNLIAGNEALTDTINQSLNENIEGIVDELRPIIGTTLGGIAQQYFNKFFDAFSIDELFPKE